MTLSSQEISDRLEIQELIAQFSHAVDNRRWSEAIALFTPDAALDYTGIHGPASNPKEVIDHVEQTLSRLKITQHLVGATTITVTGDSAQARSICHVTGVVTLAAGDHVFFTGLCYADAFTRTADGWRFCARTIEDPWFHNLPTG